MIAMPLEATYSEAREQSICKSHVTPKDVIFGPLRSVFPICIFRACEKSLSVGPPLRYIDRARYTFRATSVTRWWSLRIVVRVGAEGVEVLETIGAYNRTHTCKRQKSRSYCDIPQSLYFLLRIIFLRHTTLRT